MAQQMEAFPFLRAAYEGRIQDVLRMLRAGYTVDTANQAGLQALHFAAKTGNIEMATELLRKGAPVDATTLKGNTPLHVAALLAQTDMVKLLLRRGASVNVQADCFGDLFTPLYMAAQIGHQEIVTLLLAHGADPTIQTRNGCSAKDVAHQEGFRVVAELLDAYEKRVAQGNRELATSGGDEDIHSAIAPSKGKLRLKYGPSPTCHDVVASPRNSPKRCARNFQHLKTSPVDSKTDS